MKTQLLNASGIITITIALVTGIGAELTNLSQVLGPHAVIWVLIVTNVLSATLPSVLSILKTQDDSFKAGPNTYTSKQP
jgi:hypothetical protein